MTKAERMDDFRLQERNDWTIISKHKETDMKEIKKVTGEEVMEMLNRASQVYATVDVGRGLDDYVKELAESVSIEGQLLRVKRQDYTIGGHTYAGDTDIVKPASMGEILLSREGSGKPWSFDYSYDAYGYSGTIYFTKE